LIVAEATYRHGDPLMVNYIPAAGDIAAGQVVLLGNTAGLTCGVAHVPISNNVLGALAMGGGVYELTNLNNAANYAKVWWDDTNNKVTTVSTNNALFGFVTENGGGGANTVCRVRHFPFV
jgi:hypothetical protein